MFANQAFRCAVLFETAAQQQLWLSLVLLPVVFFGEQISFAVPVLGAQHRGTGLGKFGLAGFTKGGLKRVAPAPQLSNRKREELGITAICRRWRRFFSACWKGCGGMFSFQFCLGGRNVWEVQVWNSSLVKRICIFTSTPCIVFFYVQNITTALNLNKELIMK